MEAADFFQFFVRETGSHAVVLVPNGVDVFSFAEENAVDGLEAAEEHVDAGDAGDDDGDGAVADDEIKVVLA